MTLRVMSLTSQFSGTQSGDVTFSNHLRLLGSQAENPATTAEVPSTTT